MVGASDQVDGLKEGGFHNPKPPNNDYYGNGPIRLATLRFANSHNEHHNPHALRVKNVMADAR